MLIPTGSFVHHDRSVPLAIHFPSISNANNPHQSSANSTCIQPPMEMYPVMYPSVTQYALIPPPRMIAEPVSVLTPQLYMSTALPSSAFNTVLPSTIPVSAAGLYPIVTVITPPACTLNDSSELTMPVMSTKLEEVKTEPSIPLKFKDEDTYSGRSRRRRQRSAFVHELTYKGRYHTDSNESFHRIRVWTNENNLQYYDCECGKRKPVQDLYKIKQHVLRHDVEEHVCSICSKVFQHHLQMNAHMKVHKREGTRTTSGVVEMDSDSSFPTVSSSSGADSSLNLVRREPQASVTGDTGSPSSTSTSSQQPQSTPVQSN